MSYDPTASDSPGADDFGASRQETILAEVVEEPSEDDRHSPQNRPRLVALPVALFLATCMTTFMAGLFMGGDLDGLLRLLAARRFPPADFLVSLFLAGFAYSGPVMLILTCHEAGHFIQAHRYGVRASLPYFIPVPLPPLGTFGAVIAMDSRVRDRRALFDIGISGPLAGLVPTFVFLVWGLAWSRTGPIHPEALRFGDPLLFQFLAWLQFGPIPTGHEVYAHPMAIAGWVGLLVTSLNLLPVGQLDGGHVLYALLRRKAFPVAALVLAAAGIGVLVLTLVYGYPSWVLMLFLLFMMGPAHPPTADDSVHLGAIRIVLGWLTLAFIVVGLTPIPFIP
jgi:membrane-associated protease RseP (regulator of RpoE activity)